MKKSNKGFKNSMIAFASGIIAINLVMVYYTSKFFHRKKVKENE